MPETITRLCGHTQEFIPKGDRFDDARREKLRRKNCPACGKLKNAADNARQGGGAGKRIRKGQEPKHLPDGTRVVLYFADGFWNGSISADGTTAHAQAAGAMGILSKLARAWLAARGKKMEGKVHA